MKKSMFLAMFVSLFSVFIASNAFAMNEYKIIIKDHKFNPDNVQIPVNTKVKLVIENQDKTVEEFESFDLNREKIVGGGKSITIYVGPLKAGVYKFFGEFNPKTAQGTVTAK